MRRSHFITSIAAAAVLLCASAISAQVGQLRGHVLFKQADGTTIKAAGAEVNVYRTDLPGSFPTKADKNGEFVYAGLPFVGTYIIAVSMPNARPAFQTNVKAGRETVYELVLSPGDGRRLTADEAKKLAAADAHCGHSLRTCRRTDREVRDVLRLLDGAGNCASTAPQCGARSCQTALRWPLFAPSAQC